MTRKSKPNPDYDSPWKEAVEQLFEPCIAFFFPNVHTLIDWSQGYTFLDKEFQKITRDAKTGKRYVDKLAQVYLHSGQEAWMLLHLEVQGKPEPNFEERIFVYHYRIFDYYHRPVVSLAILTDKDPNWHPAHFGYELGGCRLSLDFPAVKLLEYRDGQEVLASHANPFAIVVLAHLQNQATKRKPAGRYAAKLNLIKLLYQRGFSEKEIRELLRFIDWVMTLPPELELQLWTDIEQYEKEMTMPYVTTFERLARQEGKIEGKVEGKVEGAIEQTQKLLLKVLDTRFKAVPDSIPFLLKNVTDVNVLQQLFDSAMTMPTLAGFEQRLASVVQAEAV